MCSDIFLPRRDKSIAHFFARSFEPIYGLSRTPFDKLFKIIKKFMRIILLFVSRSFQACAFLSGICHFLRIVNFDFWHIETLINFILFTHVLRWSNEICETKKKRRTEGERGKAHKKDRPNNSFGWFIWILVTEVFAYFVTVCMQIDRARSPHLPNHWDHTDNIIITVSNSSPSQMGFPLVFPVHEFWW